MKAIFVALPVLASLLLGSLLIPSAFAQFEAGGVDREGTWHVGEGLKQGDYFSYTMCHVDYKECVEFDMDIWIKGDVQSGSETKWLAEAVVYDGNKIIKGEIEFGKIAPEPTGGTENLGVYRGAFKSSVAWLSAFATSDSGTSGKGPKEFKAQSWGKIGNIGGEQVRPRLIETVTVQSGTWDTVQISWKTGGWRSNVWVVDEFPFPVKAETYTHVSTGIPPPEYRFSLVEYKENVQQSPFANVVPTSDIFAAKGCDTSFDKEVSIKKPTNNFDYQVHVFYGPEDPVQGCEMQWLIKFISKYDDTEFLNQVQFDFLAVDENQHIIRSIAQEEGRQFLYSPSGQYILDLIVKEDPGMANYVILVNGLAPDWTTPTSAPDFLEVGVQIFAGDDSPARIPDTKPDTVPLERPVPATATQPAQEIPDWVRNNAGWWADGSIDDESFVGGIQFLIEQGIIKIPPTSQGYGGSSEIPDWVRNNAGWWADGSIDDESFVGGIQFLIEQGILNIS